MRKLLPIAAGFVVLVLSSCSTVLPNNREMLQERKRHQEAIDKAKKDGEAAKLDFAKLSQQIDQQFAGSSAILQRLDNIYQNPFATYLSAVVYELNGEPDQAFVDLKNTYQAFP